MHSTSERGSLWRFLTSTPVRVIEVVAAVVAVVAVVLSSSVRDWLKDISRVAWTNHPHRTLAVVAVVAVALSAALLRSARRSREKDRRFAQLERQVADMEAKLAEPRPADRELFRKFQEAIPPSLVSFLRNHYFANSWPGDAFDDLHVLLEKWDDAEHEFMDPELDAARVALLDVVRVFLTKHGNESYPKRGGVNQQEVPPEWKYTDRSAEYHKSVDGLGQAATDVWEAQQRLTRLGRSKLED